MRLQTKNWQDAKQLTKSLLTFIKGQIKNEVKLLNVFFFYRSKYRQAFEENAQNQNYK
jgi:hypothetical protein